MAPTTALREGRDLSAPLDGEDRPDELVMVNVFDARMAPPSHLGSRQQVEDELDSIAAAIRSFYRKQPDQVMREAAAYTARLTELCVLLHRVESLDRTYKQVRTLQVERFITELDRQFKVASRLVEVMRQDLAMVGAMT